MSRTRFTKTLLALASLLGAIPLMAQKPAATATIAPAATAAQTFPFGRYALVAIDSLNGPPPGIEVEFTPAAVNVFQGPQMMESHAITFADGHIQFFELGGDCGEVGEYSWKFAGEWLELTQISDPCQQRSQSIMAVHFKKL